MSWHLASNHASNYDPNAHLISQALDVLEQVGAVPSQGRLVMWVGLAEIIQDEQRGDHQHLLDVCLQRCAASINSQDSPMLLLRYWWLQVPVPSAIPM